MFEQERENFVKGAGLKKCLKFLNLTFLVTRAPGKRQIKPSIALFEAEFNNGVIDGDDDEDVDFSGKFWRIIIKVHICKKIF